MKFMEQPIAKKEQYNIKQHWEAEAFLSDTMR